MSKTNAVHHGYTRQISRFVDMFAYPLSASHYVELINPLWSRRSLRAKVVKLWDETKDSRTITLRPSRGFRAHRAGQYIRVGVNIDGMHHTRTYSISSPPGSNDGTITITVKSVKDGLVSQHLVRNLKLGDYLSIGVPQGEFTLPDSMPVLPLFITAGSGITPVISILSNYAKEFRVLPDISHIHYAPHSHDMIFGKRLDNLSRNQKNYTLNKIFTRELGRAGSENLHFSAEQLNALCPDWRSREVWACGPSNLLDAIEEYWAKEGLSHQLHTERFQAKIQESDPTKVSSGKVTLTKANKEITSDGVTSILRVLEEAGVNPTHGCRMGICHSCDCKLVSGSVRDLRNGAIVSEPGDTIQICISASIGDIEVEI